MAWDSRFADLKMDQNKHRLFSAADSQFGILLLLCLVLPLLAVAMGVAGSLERRSLEQARAQLEAGAEDYAMSL
ncbi:MAG: hypothetical protein GWN58_41205, partial [Anaerolineae bacterium]|nr:hypothetical protein [Anaerolineae bacterium]